MPESLIKLIGAEELLARTRGATDLSVMRPVLNSSATVQEELVGNATLRYLEWQQIDARVNDVMRQRLTVADDLRAAGMVTPVSLGTVLRITERLDDMSAAELSYDGDTPPQRDRPSFERDTIPVPVLSKDFQINWRQLQASRERGEPLDTTAAMIATRKVRDLLQDLITNGYSRNGPAGNTIPGLTTAANRLTVTLNAHWDASGGDPVGDVERMIAAAYNADLFGPFTLYIPKNYWATIQEDYNAVGNTLRTYMERILSFSDIKAVRPDDALPNDNIVMVQMTLDVMDISEAQAVTTVQWEKNPFVTNFRVIMVGGPHIKSIQNELGNTINGIIHLS